MTEQSFSKTFKIRKTSRLQRTQEVQEQEEVANLDDLRLREPENGEDRVENTAVISINLLNVRLKRHRSS